MSHQPRTNRPELEHRSTDDSVEQTNGMTANSNGKEEQDMSTNDFNTNNMADDFDESSFWAKIKRIARRAGEEVVSKLLIAFYVADDAETAVWAKTALYGALAYFVLPIDAIPDFMPGVGYTDDMAALAAGMVATAGYVKSRHVKRANAQLKRWFG
tara:strand:+ start:14359 stop:14826 length:468 start_codon:yes stop_codon:yes gene_type:complete